MSKILIKYNECTTDDKEPIFYFDVMDETEYEVLSKSIVRYDRFVNVYNQCDSISYDTGKDFISKLKITQISEEEYSTFVKHFKKSFGIDVLTMVFNQVTA